MVALPLSLFELPPGASWLNSDDYPEIGDANGQRWAWEFLRRNARYVEGYKILQAYLTKDSDDELYPVEELVDRFCLEWQIKEPVAPCLKWHDLSLSTQHNLIGPISAKKFLPEFGVKQEMEGETAPICEVSVATTPYQLVVRVAIDGDPTEQGQRVTAMLRELREPIPDKMRDGKSRDASLHDRTAPLRYVNVRPISVKNLKDGTTRTVKALTYGRPVTRVPSRYLHFVLRTLDAIVDEHNPQRDQLESDRTFFSNDDAKNRAEMRKWLVKYPFGEGAEDWVQPLSKDIAKAFRNELTSSSYQGDLKSRMTPSNVREWMRYARRCALEQGYVQLATNLER